MGLFVGPSPSLPCTCPSCFGPVTYDDEARPKRCWSCGPLELDVENWQLIALKDQVKQVTYISAGHGFRQSLVRTEVQGAYRYALTGKGVTALYIQLAGLLTSVLCNFFLSNGINAALGILVGQVFALLVLSRIPGIVVKVTRSV